MSRREFERVTVISANPSYNVKYVDASVFGALAVNDTVEVKVFSPAGTISEVTNMYLMWTKLAGATSGNRLLWAGVANGLIGCLWAVYNYTDDIYYRYGLFEGTPQQKFPDTTGAQTDQQKVSYDENDGLSFKFTNQTNGADTGVEKRVRIWLKETKII